MQRRIGLVLLVTAAQLSIAVGDDWPMWRKAAGRTGATETALSESLQLQWVRHLPHSTPVFHNPRLQFDAGYEPAVTDGKLLIASSRTDSATSTMR